MQSQCYTIGADELAQALGWSRDYFLSRCGFLHASAGMPRRIPGTKVWSRKLIEAWLETAADDLAQAAPAPGSGRRFAAARAAKGHGGSDYVDAARKMLEARIDRGAAA